MFFCVLTNLVTMFHNNHNPQKLLPRVHCFACSPKKRTMSNYQNHPKSLAIFSLVIFVFGNISLWNFSFELYCIVLYCNGHEWHHLWGCY